MTITTHTAVGAAIGYSVGSPLLGFVLGFILHFLLDMIPHGDSKISSDLRVRKIHKKTAIAYGSIDAIVAIFLLLVLMNDPAHPNSLIFTASIAGSILPDLLVGLNDITNFKYLKKFNKMHFFFHDYFVIRYRDVKLHYSLIAQAGFIAILLNIT